MAINVAAAEISVSVVVRGNLTHNPPAARNTALDTTYNCASTTAAGVPLGIPVIVVTQLGNWSNIGVTASPIQVTVTQLGTAVIGLLLSTTTASIITTTVTMLTPSIVTSELGTNWIKWSDIGSINFTVGKDNVAGERPLDWKGYIYEVKKLSSKVIIYGENGVSILTPSGASFGLNTIYRIGLKGKHAVTGDDTKHFFLDNSGQLWKLAESLKLLDYSEYLSALNKSVVMSYDMLANVIYICDGVLGFIYDLVTDSLGKCQVNITGVGYQSGTQYVVASSTIVNTPFEICTDIYDLGARVGKTVFSLEFGTDLTTDLYAAIDYRRDKAGSFVQTPWYSVSSIGRVFITAWGREFRIRIKTSSYEYFELDYIKINGVADAY